MCSSDLNMDAGSTEYYENQGSFLSPTINSNISRAYHTLSLKLDPLTNQDARFTQIDLFLMGAQSPVTISPSIAITNNTVQTIEWKLPPTVITNDLQYKIKVTAYQFNQTPFIKEITLYW